MKKFLFLIALALGMALYSSAQDKVMKGLAVGKSRTLIDTTEIKSLNGISGNVQELLNLKTNTADIVNSSWYTDAEVDSISKFDSFLNSLRILGTSIIGVPVAAPIPQSVANYTVVDGQLYGVAIKVDKAGTANGLYFGSNTSGAGAFTEDEFNGVALFSRSGSTYTQIAISANTPAFFKTSGGGYTTAPFATPVAVTPGVYYAVFLANWSAFTVNPLLQTSTFPAIHQYGYKLPTGVFFAFTLAAQTTIPATIDGTTVTRSDKIIPITLY